MTKPTTTITIGYDTYLVEPAKVSAILAIFADMRQVEDRYVGDGVSVLVLQNDGKTPRITVRQDRLEVVSPDEHKALREAHEAKQAVAEAAEAAAEQEVTETTA